MLAERLTPEHVRRLGVLSARLHEHAATFRPPPDLPVRTLDRLTRSDERSIVAGSARSTRPAADPPPAATVQTVPSLNLAVPTLRV